MSSTLLFEGYDIETVATEREINFVVTRQGEYVCRLVPGTDGFELSVLDRAIDHDVDDGLVDWLGDFIVSHYD
jgi:hypothetical protein